MLTRIFIRHSKLNLPYSSHADMPFETLVSLGNGTLDPPIDPLFFEKQRTYIEKNLLCYPFRHMVVSPSTRTQTTAAAFMENIPLDKRHEYVLHSSEDLREIMFDLNALYPLADHSPVDISLVNESVLRAVGEQRVGCESVSSVQDRIESVIRLSSHGALKHDTILFVTHGFFMAVFETAIRKGRNTGITYNNLQQAINYKYLEGFATNSDFSVLVPIRRLS